MRIRIEIYVRKESSRLYTCIFPQSENAAEYFII